MEFTDVGSARSICATQYLRSAMNASITGASSRSFLMTQIGTLTIGGMNGLLNPGICIIGAGGIGASLLVQLAPMLSINPIAERVGGVEISIFDSDVVDQRNIHHQPFQRGDIGKSKVAVLCEMMRDLQTKFLSIRGHETDIRGPGELIDYDIVVACVDSSTARIATHTKKGLWLDLRCRGDNYLALDHRVDSRFVDSVTDPEQISGSCQFDGAVESGNVQFGHFWAAAHGCQWIIQCLRTIIGDEGAMLPLPKSESITFGTLERFPLHEGGY
jgi:hypothetical protein